MPRKPSSTLTDAELRLMEVIWTRGPSMVSDVVEALLPDQPLAYSSVLTTLRILEQKGYLRHEKVGRAFVYHPIVGRNEARQGALRYVLDRFFDNSPELLVLNILENDTMDEDDLARLKSLINKAPPDENLP